MTDLEKLLAEKKEVNELAEVGFIFSAGNREFHIKPLTFGTMVHANRYALQMKINLLDPSANLFEEIGKNEEAMMNFIATCILADPQRIHLEQAKTAKFLRWSLKPRDAIGIVFQILQMYDLANFITSIRLLGQMTTMTSPKAETPLIDG